MEINLEISDKQYMKLPTTQKVDLIYFNQTKLLESHEQHMKLWEEQLTIVQKIKRMQKMQWIGLGGLFTGLGIVAAKFYDHIISKVL